MCERKCYRGLIAVCHITRFLSDQFQRAKNVFSQGAYTEDPIPFYISGTAYNSLETDTPCASWMIPVTSPDAQPVLVLRYDEEEDVSVVNVPFAGNVPADQEQSFKIAYEMCYYRFNTHPDTKVKIKIIDDQAFMVLDRQRLFLDNHYLNTSTMSVLCHISIWNLLKPCIFVCETIKEHTHTCGKYIYENKIGCNNAMWIIYICVWIFDKAITLFTATDTHRTESSLLQVYV